MRAWCRAEAWGCRVEAWGCRAEAWVCRLEAWGCRPHRALLLEDEALGRVDVDADQPLQQLSHGGPAEALHRALALCGATREA